MLFQWRRESPACFHFRIRSQTSDTKPFPSYSPHKTHHIAPAAPYFRPPQGRFVVLLKGKSPVLLCRTRHHRLIPYAHRMSHNASEANATPKIRHRESIAFNCSILSMPLSVRVFLLCISENGFSYAGDSAADNVLADRIALC